MAGLGLRAQDVDLGLGLRVTGAGIWDLGLRLGVKSVLESEYLFLMPNSASYRVIGLWLVVVFPSCPFLSRSSRLLRLDYNLKGGSPKCSLCWIGGGSHTYGVEATVRPMFMELPLFCGLSLIYIPNIR